VHTLRIVRGRLPLVNSVNEASRRRHDTPMVVLRGGY
jgi:hypothetical protein